MAYITLILLLMMLIISLFCSRDILHPAAITAGLWFSVLAIYTFVPCGMYALSARFYGALLCWVVPFFCAAMLTNKLAIRSIFFDGRIGQTRAVLLAPIVVTAAMIAMTLVIILGSHYNIYNFFHGIRSASIANVHHQAIFQHPAWASPIFIATNILLLPMTLYFCFFREKKDIWTVLLVVSLIGYEVLRANKMGLMQMGAAFLCLMWVKKSVPRVWFIALAILLPVAMYLMQTLRSLHANGDMVRMLQIYLLSPMAAFDYVVNLRHSLIQSFHGEFTFNEWIPLIRIWDSSLVGNADPRCFSHWVEVPVPTNVYTVMFNYYADFDMLGIAVFGALYGFAFGCLYQHTRQGNQASSIAYAYLFSILLLQFYADCGLWQSKASMVGLIGIILLTAKPKWTEPHIANLSKSPRYATC